MTRPLALTQTMSVNVPPISIPILISRSSEWFRIFSRPGSEFQSSDTSKPTFRPRFAVGSALQKGGRDRRVSPPGRRVPAGSRRYFPEVPLLAARGESPAGRVASAVGPDARRADRGDVGSSSRRRYTADGPTPPQPIGRQGFAAAGRRYSSSPMSRHRLLLVPCQPPQIPGARLHATFTTGC